MRKVIPILLIGSLIIILFDTFASLISVTFQINYLLSIFGSILIYALVGFFSAKRSNLLWAGIASGIVGLVDSTLGWYISWIIGAGRPEIEVNLTSIIATIIFVVIVSSLFGFIGGFASQWT